MKVFLVGGEAAGDIVDVDNRQDYVEVAVRGALSAFPLPEDRDRPVPFIREIYKVHKIFVERHAIVFGVPPEWDPLQLLHELQRGYKEAVDLKRRFE